MQSKRGVFISGILIGACLAGAGGYAYLKLTKKLPLETYALRDDILVHGNQNLKEIALTFDDGPHPETARRMLDILGKEKVKATFFVVGKKVEESPRLIRRMMKEGHEVANHTYSHPRLDGLDAEQIRQEIAKCGHAVFEATGAGMNLFRPPGMRYDEIVIRTAQDLGYVTIHWNTAAQDFQPQEPTRIVEKVLKRTQPGSVILLHSHPNTLEALPEILSGLKAKGYRFVRVSQMLGRLPRPVYVNTNAYGVKSEIVAKPASEPQKTSQHLVRKSAQRRPSKSEPESFWEGDEPSSN